MGPFFTVSSSPSKRLSHAWVMLWAGNRSIGGGYDGTGTRTASGGGSLPARKDARGAAAGSRGGRGARLPARGMDRDRAGLVAPRYRLRDYSYAAGTDGVIHYAQIGKFCSIASHVAINPGDHPMGRVTHHHLTYRRRQFGLAPQDDAEFFDWRRAKPSVSATTSGSGTAPRSWPASRSAPGPSSVLGRW